jgi:hypothetical protein
LENIKSVHLTAIICLLRAPFVVGGPHEEHWQAAFVFPKILKYLGFPRPPPQKKNFHVQAVLTAIHYHHSSPLESNSWTGSQSVYDPTSFQSAIILYMITPTADPKFSEPNFEKLC